MVFEKWVNQLVEEALTFPVHIIDETGKETIYAGNKTGQPVTIHFHESFNFKEMMKQGVSIYLGELYMNGKVDVTGENRPLQRLVASGYHLIDLVVSNPRLSRLIPKVKEHHHSHTEQQNKQDIHNHYDISNDFYRLWLDKTMTYSCAYFEKKTDTLEQAQQNKVHHILAKLKPERGKTLVDIGCGWGTLMLTACQEYDLKVTGVTLSEEQYQYVNHRIHELGLEDRAEVILEDYRELTGRQFDYVVSVGMFEHVGAEELPRYFQIVADLLNQDGRALIHGITRQQGGATDAWMDKYIFPGGYVPGLVEVMNCIVDSKAQIFDMETLRRHYQHTLEIWDDNFNRVREQVKAMGKDEAFIRMWDLYLQACAGSFEAGNIDCIQYLITKQASGTGLPMTRDYMYQSEE